MDWGGRFFIHTNQLFIHLIPFYDEHKIFYERHYCLTDPWRGAISDKLPRQH
jgi:hypothetical protein